MSYDAAGNLIGLVNAAGKSSSFTRDSLGRITSYTDPNGNKTTYSYTGSGQRPTLITHPDGTTQQKTYNQFGETTKVVDENGNTTTFAYDASGNPITAHRCAGKSHGLHLPRAEPGHGH